MNILFITEQGASVKKFSERIVVAKDGIELTDIPVHKTSAVIVFGNVQFSTQVLALLASNKITVSYLYFNGKLKCQSIPPSDKNLDLRFNQYQAVNDEEFSINLIKQLLVDKIDAEIELYRNNRIKNENFTLTEIKHRMDYFKNEIYTANDYNQLLGLEGSSSKQHFEYYSFLFLKDLKFTTRTKRPPKDEVSALLSLGYTLLLPIINSFCCAAGLDVYNGFLHKMEYNRPSLALDVLEIFRAPIVDRFVLTSCNLSVFSKADFLNTELRGYYLKEQEFKKYLTFWNKFLTAPELDFYNQLNYAVTSLTKMIREQKVSSLRKN
jgi:CRISPR-associated protein Cas1